MTYIYLYSKTKSAMTIFSFSAVFAMAIFPVPSGWLALIDSGWRYISWIQMVSENRFNNKVDWLMKIFQGIAIIWSIFMFSVLKETRASIILIKKAENVRNKEKDERYQSELKKPELSQLLKVSCFRPINMLISEPIVSKFCKVFAVI